MGKSKEWLAGRLEVIQTCYKSFEEAVDKGIIIANIAIVTRIIIMMAIALPTVAVTITWKLL